MNAVVYAIGRVSNPLKGSLQKLEGMPVHMDLRSFMNIVTGQ